MKMRRKTAALLLATLSLLSLGAATGMTPNGVRAGAVAPASGPAPVRRLTEAQYRRAIADIFGEDIKVVGRFEPDLRVDGLLAVGTSAISVSPAGLEQYDDIGRGVAEQATDAGHWDKLVGCPRDAHGAEALSCARRFFSQTGLKLFRRPLPAAEAERLARSAVAIGDQLKAFPQGVATTLAGMLASPQFLFRLELPEASGRLDGYAKASRLSFLLWNSAPDDALLEAAAAGSLDTPAGLRAQVERLMASPRLRDGVRAFFTDFLQLDEFETLSKDGLIYPAFSASIASLAREQTLRTLTDLLIDRNGDYRDIFTTRRIAMTRTLGPIYDVPVARDGWYIHEFPQGDPRVGLLTHAGLLALHSHPGRTSPTLRGKAMREILLCEKIPSPPANVNFAVVQDVNNASLKTTRQRLQAHLDDEECASCHKKTDPIGLGLEQFDGAGQFRTHERGELIDVSGSFDKKAFDGAGDLGQLFHDSAAASACLVNSVWRYANGRNPSAGDEDDIRALSAQFSGQGYRLTSLLRTIALDPAFYGTSTDVRIARTHEGKKEG